MNAPIRDLAVPALGAALGVSVLVLAPSQLPGASLADAADMRSPVFFPIVAAGLVIAAALADATRVLSGAANRPGAPWAWRRPATLAAAFGLYLVSIPLIGMMTAVSLLMFVISRVFGYPRVGHSAALALVASGLIYLLFERVLLILFPHGRLF